MKAGKEDVTKKMVTVAQGMEKVQKGQDQLKGEIKKNTTAIEKLKEGQQKNKKKSLASRYTARAGCGRHPEFWAKEARVSRMG